LWQLFEKHPFTLDILEKSLGLLQIATGDLVVKKCEKCIKMSVKRRSIFLQYFKKGLALQK